MNPRTPTGVDLESLRSERDPFTKRSHQKIVFTEQDILNIVNTLKIANRSEHYINDVKRKLYEFAKFTNWKFDFNDVAAFFERMKRYSPSSYRKYVLHVRTLLKNLGVPYWNKITLPKVPKRQKEVIKKDVVEQVVLNLLGLWNLQQVTRWRIATAFILAATSGLRTKEVCGLTREDIDLRKRIVYVRYGDSAATRKTIKDYEERITFFTIEAQQFLRHFFKIYKGSEIFNDRSIRHVYEVAPQTFRVNGQDIRLKHMRKFFSQQSDRLGMPTAVKKLLMGHSLRGDVDLQHYDYQDEEELKQIYDRYWRDFRILDELEHHVPRKRELK